MKQTTPVPARTTAEVDESAREGALDGATGPRSRDEVRRGEYTVDVLRPADWEAIKDRVVEIEELCFSGKLDAAGREQIAQWRRNVLLDPEKTVIIARNASNELVGYTYAEPGKDPDTAHLQLTAVHPEYQGQKIGPMLNEALEDALRDQGYTKMTRDSIISNGWADKLERHYGRRILDAYNTLTHRNFLIEL